MLAAAGIFRNYLEHCDIESGVINHGYSYSTGMIGAGVISRTFSSVIVEQPVQNRSVAAKR